MCVVSALCGMVLGWLFGWAYGHAKGDKEGRIEGARLQLSKETYANSPIKGEFDADTLTEAGKRHDKEIKPKENESKEVSSLMDSVVTAAQWAVVLGVVVYVGYLYLD